MSYSTLTPEQRLDIALLYHNRDEIDAPLHFTNEEAKQLAENHKMLLALSKEYKINYTQIGKIVREQGIKMKAYSTNKKRLFLNENGSIVSLSGKGVKSRLPLATGSTPTTARSSWMIPVKNIDAINSNVCLNCLKDFKKSPNTSVMINVNDPIFKGKSQRAILTGFKKILKHKFKKIKIYTRKKQIFLENE